MKQTVLANNINLQTRFLKQSSFLAKFLRFKIGKASTVYCKRIMDILLSLLLLISLAPLLLTIYLLFYRQLSFRKEEMVGMLGKTFWCYKLDLTENRVSSFIRKLYFDRFLLLLNVLLGDMSIVGPRPLRSIEVDSRQALQRTRHEVKPGMICLWWIRQRANIDYNSELDIDSEYVVTQSTKADLGIVLRSLLAAFYGVRNGEVAKIVDVLGIPIHNLSMKEAVTEILKPRLEPIQISFINADCANISQKDRRYFDTLQSSDFNFADGIGLKLAGRILSKEIKQNVNGTDLFPLLCKELEDSDKGIFLLGGRPGVAEDVCKWIEKNYPKVKVKGFHHGFFTADEETGVIGKISESGAQILLVAMGAPKQEKWLRHYLEETGVKVGIGVGGLFDFYSGRIPRAPLWMREIGCEWLYRFYQEPRRMWRRYFVGNFLFLARVVFQRIFDVR